MKRKRWMLLVFAAVVAAVGIMVWIANRANHANGTGRETGSAETVVAERPAAEQGFLDTVLASPEALDGERAEGPGVRRQPTGDTALTPAVPVCTLPTGKERHLLSDVEKPSAPQPLAEPVAADSLHFRQDYASLRTDAVRNPDSPENREGVVSLMEARQRRLGQQ